MKTRTAVLLFFVLIVAHSVLAAESRKEYRYEFKLNPNGQVSLDNVNGDVVVRGWSENRVEIKAVKRGKERNFDLVEIEIKADADRISIHTEYPRTQRDTDVAVDYELSIPRTASLENFSTVNGDVEIADISGTIRTSSVNGSVDVRNAQASVDSETVNGSIDVQLAAMPPAARIDMQSVNGSLDLWLPDSANADVSARSLNGSIQSDFPITVQGKFGSRKMSGKIGTGGARIDMETVNGRIQLSRLN